MMPVYNPATWDGESVKVRVGFQVTELAPVPLVQDAPVPGREPLARLAGTKVPVPVLFPLPAE